MADYAPSALDLQLFPSLGKTTAQLQALADPSWAGVWKGMQQQQNPQTGMPAGATLRDIAKGRVNNLGVPQAAAPPATQPNAAGVTPKSLTNFNEAPGNYTGGMNLDSYLDPSFKFALDQGLDAIRSSYAGAGNFLSGTALKGITDYSQNSALNKAYIPAWNQYMQDKTFNWGVDTNDRDFAYGTQRDDRNFNQQAQQFLARLGLDSTTANANLVTELGKLLAMNSLAAGQAAGAGTIAQGNAITGTTSDLITQFIINSILNKGS